MTRNPNNAFQGFNTNFRGDQPPVNWLLLAVLSVSCFGAAAVGWFAAGALVLAPGLLLGYILMPALAGAASGLLMGRLGVSLRTHGCVAACIATGLACIAGDIAYTAYFNMVYKGMTLGDLFGANLVSTLNATFRPDKAMLIALAVWLTYLLCKPRVYQSQVATA